MGMAKREQEVRDWFAEMDSREGIYDKHIAAGADDFIGPKERLHSMYLKRLYGQHVTLHLPPIQELGDVALDGSIVFDLHELQRHGMTSTLPFTSSEGATGLVEVDWLHLQLLFKLDVEPGADPVMNMYPYQIHRLRAFSVGLVSADTLDIGLVVDVEPMHLENRSDTTERGFLSDFGACKIDIECGVLADAGKGYNCLPPATFKDISEITGVPASTLSNLKNGKKSIENMTYSTLELLSFYGQIKLLDSMMYDMLVRHGGKEKKAYQLAESKTHYVQITMKDGGMYIIDAASYDSAVKLLDAHIEMFDDTRPSMTLAHVVNQDGIKFSGIMVRKDDIQTIHIGIRPTFTAAEIVDLVGQ